MAGARWVLAEQRMAFFSWNDVVVVVCNDNNVDKIVVHHEDMLVVGQITAEAF